MKKLISICLATLCLVGCTSTPKETEKPKETASPDVFTSASVNNFYEGSSWTGDQLIEGIKTRSGSWTIATVNPDNTPNLAVAVFGMLDDNTLVLNLAPNQTGENIVRTKQAVAIIYQYTNDQEIDKALRNQGAKLKLELVSEEEFKKYQEENPDTVTETSLVFRIVEVLPLG